MSANTTTKTFLVPVDERACTWIKHYAQIEAKSAQEAYDKIAEACERLDAFRKYELSASKRGVEAKRYPICAN